MSRGLFTAQPVALLPPLRWRRVDLCWLGLAAAAVAAVYAPVAGHGFVVWDDPAYVSANARILLGLSADNLRWAAGALQMGNWHPLTLISHMADVTLFGRDAGGHHLMSAFLHLVVSGLFFAFLRVCGMRSWIAGSMALVFAVHPLHVESVAWISARKDLVAGLFWMMTLLAYRRYAMAPSPARYAAVTVLLALALAGKAVAVTLPVVLLLLDAWPLRRFPADRAGKRRLILEKLPWLALSLIVAGLTVQAQLGAGAVSTDEAVPFAARPALAAHAYLAYLADSVFPHDLAYLYEIRALSPAAALGVLAVVAVGAAGLLHQWTRRPGLAVGVAWFAIVLLPMIGLIHVGFHARADRYMYLPLAGLLLALAWALQTASASLRRLAAAALALWLLVAAAYAHEYVRTWRDSESLYRRALAVSPDHCMARAGLAHVRSEQGADAEAAALIAAIEAHCSARRPRELAGLLAGRLAQRQGRVDEAERRYRAVLVLSPASSDARRHLGALLLEQKRYDAAADLLLAAEDATRRDAQSERQLAAALLQSPRHRAEAVERFRRWAAEAPDDAARWFYLGVALDQAGEMTEAIAAYERSVALDSGNITAQLRRVAALVTIGRLNEARTAVEAVLARQPADPSALALRARIVGAGG